MTPITYNELVVDFEIMQRGWLSDERLAELIEAAQGAYSTDADGNMAGSFVSWNPRTIESLLTELQERRLRERERLRNHLAKRA